LSQTHAHRLPAGIGDKCKVEVAAGEMSNAGLTAALMALISPQTKKAGRRKRPAARSC